MDAIIRVEQNNNNSIKKVEKEVNKKEKVEEWKGNYLEKIEVYEERFYMKGVTKALRYVKYVTGNSKKQRSQILIITICLDMPLKSLYKIVKARWEIENSIFNNLKSEAKM